MEKCPQGRTTTKNDAGVFGVLEKAVLFPFDFTWAFPLFVFSLSFRVDLIFERTGEANGVMCGLFTCYSGELFPGLGYGIMGSPRHGGTRTLPPFLPIQSLLFLLSNRDLPFHVKDFFLFKLKKENKSEVAGHV